jgi:hypothetical protein
MRWSSGAGATDTIGKFHQSGLLDRPPLPIRSGSGSHSCNVMWTRLPGTSDATFDDDGYLHVAGNSSDRSIFVSLVDQNGNAVWTRTYSSDSALQAGPAIPDADHPFDAPTLEFGKVTAVAGSCGGTTATAPPGLAAGWAASSI